MNNLIGLVGYGRCGKDRLGAALVPLGWQRACWGDIIKRQLDSVIQKHFDFSAFTERDGEKAVIRRVLEEWGEANFHNISREFFHNLPARCVNTRILGARQAALWREMGGILVWVERPGARPKTEFEARTFAELTRRDLIDLKVINDGTERHLGKAAEEILADRKRMEELVRPGNRPGIVRCGGLVLAEPGPVGCPSGFPA